ncbi:MAG: pitrilysin family protein, partial [Clostridia bacterium]|nr:pitrilysin family protein [Clostridia bacterium]
GCWEDTGCSGDYDKMTPMEGKIITKVKDIEQLHICMGFPGTPFGDAGIYPQALVNSILGGSMSSRLFQRIREEMGMAYSIYTFPNSYVGCGSFGIYAGVSPKNGKTVLEEINRELDKFLKEGITEEEFRSAKTQLRSGYLMGLESPGSRMQNLGRSMLLLGKAKDPAETIAQIEAVTMEATMEAARRILTPKPCIAVVGKNADEFNI